MSDSNRPPEFPHLSADISWTWQTHDPATWPDLFSWLTDRERALFDSFQSEKRRIEFVLGRAAARRLVARISGVEPPDVRFSIAEDGVVEVAGGDGLYLSISHAGGWATAALSPRPVGMDMERLARRRPGIYRRFLAPEEYSYLEGTDLDHDRLQILLWTLKEAVLKGTRTGLRVSPQGIRIQKLDLRGTASLLDRDEYLWRLNWFFWRGCYLAVADRENLH